MAIHGSCGSGTRLDIVAVDHDLTEDHIAEIRRSIVEADLGPSAPIARIERIVESDHDTTGAEARLRGLERILERWHVRRQLILGVLWRR